MGLLNFLFLSENIENVCIKRLVPKLKEWKIDTLVISTSNKCSYCSKYNLKVYSLYGKNKNFPILPVFLKTNNCPYCGVNIGASTYFEGISRKPKYQIRISKITTSKDCIQLNGVTIDMYSLYCKYPNDKISAIKEFRKLTSCSLSDGKHHIDAYYKDVNK